MSLFDSASIVVTPNAYKASKLYAIKPTDGSGDLTVVRATTATRVNSSGLIESVSANVPRLDYTNSTCPSILVEPQRTNVTQQSEDFSNGYWVKTNSDITSNTAIAPDGNLTADTFSDRVLTNQTYPIARNQSYTSGTAYTSSFFAKNLDRRYVYMRFVSAVFGTNKYVFFDLQLGTIISVSSGVTAQIIDYGNGWFRCIATSTASATTTTVNGIFIGLSDNGVNVSYTNPSVKSIYLWGAQLEAGANATSYIPTTSASVTRNADVISKTGITDLIGQTEGTVLIDFNYKNINQSVPLFSIDNGTTAQRINGTLNTTRNVILEVRNGVTTTQLILSSQINSGNRKIAFAYKNGDYAIYINGALAGTSTNSTNFPTTALSQFVLSNASYGYLNDSYNLVSHWKTRLTNDELATLTTI